MGVLMNKKLLALVLLLASMPGCWFWGPRYKCERPCEPTCYEEQAPCGDVCEEQPTCYEEQAECGYPEYEEESFMDLEEE